MRDKRLFILLRKLNEDELGKFNDFLHSPFHNKDKRVLDLWSCIKQYAPNFAQHDLLYYAKYAHIYEKQSSVDKLFSKTAQLLEDCLGHLAFREMHPYRMHLIFKELKRLQALKEFKNLYNSEAKKLEGKSVKGKEYYYHKFLWGMDWLSYMANLNAEPKERAQHLATLLDDLDTSYLLYKLPISTELENLKNLRNKIEGTSVLQEAIERELQDGWKSDNPLVLAHYMAFRVVVYNKEEDFEALMVLLNEHQGQIPREELFTLYTFAVNFCIKMLRKKNEAYQKVLFDIYQTFLRLQILDANSFVDLAHFRNMVVIGCRLKKYEETRALIHEFEDKVNSDFKESFIHSLFGLVAYRQKDYKKALEEFNLMEQKGNALYKVDAQFVRVKIHYETWSPNDKHCFFSTEFHNFERRAPKAKVLSEKQREAYRNFCKVIAPMFDLKTNPNSKHTVAKIRKKLMGFERVADERWVLEQLGKL